MLAQKFLPHLNISKKNSINHFKVSIYMFLMTTGVSVVAGYLPRANACIARCVTSPAYRRVAEIPNLLNDYILLA